MTHSLESYLDTPLEGVLPSGSRWKCPHGNSIEVRALTLKIMKGESVMNRSTGFVSKDFATVAQASPSLDDYKYAGSEPYTAIFHRARSLRRMVDPVGHPATKHIFYVRVKDMPTNVSNDANPRDTNTSRAVYRGITESLLGTEDTDDIGWFHYKHHGITILADDVVVKDLGKDEHNVEVKFLGHPRGSIDGGHSMQLFREVLKDLTKTIPDEQYVQVNVLVGIPDDQIPKIAGGLNTGMQVKQHSLDNLSNLFDGIKCVLADMPYADKVSYRENEDLPISILDILSVMACFNIEQYPNKAEPGRAQIHPISAYEKRSAILTEFERYPASYEKTLPILAEALELYDIIRSQFAEAARKALPGSKPGGWRITDRRPTRPHAFYFLPIDASSQPDAYPKRDIDAPRKGALYPMLAAFRWMVEEGQDGKFQWRGGFESVREVWMQVGGELAHAAYEASYRLASPDAIGKDRTFWANLHNTVARHELELRAAKLSL